jgi:acyl-CoA thioester hydrolase
MSREALLPRASYRHWTNIQTRWADNDAYGHVNNTVHYQWFDTVVNAWLIEQGLLDIEHGNPIGLVVETGCRYATSLAFPQAVEVGLAVQRLGGSSVTYRLGVFAAGSHEPAAQGHFTHVYVDRDSRRPVPLPEAWRAVLSQLA